jgi:hypothetical protein
MIELGLMVNKLQILFIRNDKNSDIVGVLKIFNKMKSVLLSERHILSYMLVKHNDTSEIITSLHKEIQELQSENFNGMDISIVNSIKSELNRIASSYPKP